MAHSDQKEDGLADRFFSVSTDILTDLRQTIVLNAVDQYRAPIVLDEGRI
jgi:hypothetical protein